MKKFAFIVLLLIPGWTIAQQQDSATFRTGTYVSSTVSGARSLTYLNQQLQTAGHVPLLEALVGVAVGVTKRFADQNSYQAARVSILVSADDALDNSRSTSLLVAELGSFTYYDLIANPKWLAYPYLGIGVNYGRLTVSAIEPNSNFQTSLNNLGDDEVIQKRYGSDGLMLFGELGGGVERVLTLQGTDLYLGLSGGYRISTKRSWVLKGVKTYGDAFSTQGWTFELKVRLEMNPNYTPKVSRGLLRFFK